MGVCNANPAKYKVSRSFWGSKNTKIQRRKRVKPWWASGYASAKLIESPRFKTVIAAIKMSSISKNSAMAATEGGADITAARGGGDNVSTANDTVETITGALSTKEALLRLLHNDPDGIARAMAAMLAHQGSAKAVTPGLAACTE